MALGVRLAVEREYAAERAHFVERSRSGAANVVRTVHDAMHEIYESLRTLAALPSVRNIDRHGRTLSEDGRETIQQVYNNLASSVSVSEVYIVPADLDPDRTDPVTGKLEEPILMFDEL